MPADAQTWLYSGTNYGTGANWSTGTVPGAGQTATFNSAGANQPVISSGPFTIGTVNMTAGSLTINATRTLNVQSAYNLSDASILGTGTLALGAGSALAVGGTTAVTVAPVVSGSGAVSIGRRLMDPLAELVKLHEEDDAHEPVTRIWITASGADDDFPERVTAILVGTAGEDEGQLYSIEPEVLLAHIDSVESYRPGDAIPVLA